MTTIDSIRISQQPSKAGNYYFVLIYILVALYAICYQLQRPIEPFLVDRLIHNKDSSSSSSSQQAYGNTYVYVITYVAAIYKN